MIEVQQRERQQGRTPKARKAKKMNRTARINEEVNTATEILKLEKTIQTTTSNYGPNVWSIKTENKSVLIIDNTAAVRETYPNYETEVEIMGVRDDNEVFTYDSFGSIHAFIVSNLSE